MSAGEALILFTRLPLPGQTKTRLMHWLTPEQCAKLHRAMLQDISETLQKTGRDIFVFYTPDGDLTELRRLCGKAVYLPQRGAGLGERMDQAIREVLASGYGSCLLLGSDIPETTAKDIDTAGALLREHDVVLSPTEDGGYWMIGLKQPCSAIFTRQPYGTENAFLSALKTCEQARLHVAIGPRLRDIDQIEDLRHYGAYPRKEMAHTQALIEELMRGLVAPDSEQA
jgi:rSAM/selenodomain-associated transferase 1